MFHSIPVDETPSATDDSLRYTLEVRAAASPLQTFPFFKKRKKTGERTEMRERERKDEE